jgi:hypothetical protein
MQKKSNTLFIYHHLGLGDHISCHGIVRHYCGLWENVFLFVKPQNLKNIQYMYNDIKNLNFLVGEDIQAITYLRKYNPPDVLYVGAVTINGYDASKLTAENGNFEEQFYKMAEIPFEYKYSKFFINRDLNKEKELFDSLNLKPQEYAFVHSGGNELKEEFFENSNIRRVSPDTHDFFDWIYVIENAKEIHCMDSSFLCLIDCLNLDKSIPLFNHRYVRGYPDFIKIGGNKNWNFIK